MNVKTIKSRPLKTVFCVQDPTDDSMCVFSTKNSLSFILTKYAFPLFKFHVGCFTIALPTATNSTSAILWSSKQYMLDLFAHTPTRMYGVIL